VSKAKELKKRYWAEEANLVSFGKSRLTPHASGSSFQRVSCLVAEKGPLDDGTKPTRSRRPCCPRYGLQKRDWAGVAKRSRELVSHLQPSVAQTNHLQVFVW
jgi:hypothetical protein